FLPDFRFTLVFTYLTRDTWIFLRFVATIVFFSNCLEHWAVAGLPFNKIRPGDIVFDSSTINITYGEKYVSTKASPAHATFSFLCNFCLCCSIYVPYLPSYFLCLPLLIKQ